MSSSRINFYDGFRWCAGSMLRRNLEDQLLSGSCSSVCSALHFQSLCLSLTPDGTWFFFFPSWPVCANHMHSLTMMV